MNVTIYPKWDECSSGSQCAAKKFQCVPCFDDMGGYGKRLSDAELAAEYQFSRLDSRVRMARQHNCPDSKTLFDHYERGLEQEWTLERFATLPHYDEDQP
jgi:hypothetical protein